jgi:hypothetical protein
MCVEQSHIIDDIEKERARLARAARTVTDLLQVTHHAVEHDRKEVASEYILRAIEELWKALGK